MDLVFVLVHVFVSVTTPKAAINGIPDIDGDGHLSHHELSNHLEATRDELFPHHHSRVRESFTSVDTNHNDRIEFEEHLHSINQLIQRMKQEMAGQYIAPEVG